MTAMLRHALLCLLLASLVLGAGLLAAGPHGASGVVAGTSIALLFQVLFVGGPLAFFFARSPLAIFGLGMLGRVLLLAATALAIVPALGLPAAATLFSMVTVLFLTTLSEPLVFRAQPEPSR